MFVSTKMQKCLTKNMLQKTPEMFPNNSDGSNNKWSFQQQSRSVVFHHFKIKILLSVRFSGKTKTCFPNSMSNAISHSEWVLISTIILLSLPSVSHDAWLNINAFKHRTRSHWKLLQIAFPLFGCVHSDYDNEPLSCKRVS